LEIARDNQPHIFALLFKFLSSNSPPLSPSLGKGGGRRGRGASPLLNTTFPFFICPRVWFLLRALR